MKKTVGVLGFQGGIEEHISIIERIGHRSLKVLLKEDLDSCDALIIPGGESSVISAFLKESGLGGEIVTRVKAGMPIMGTCAGAILLAKTVLDDDLVSLNLIDMEVLRNAYGKQLDSFYAEIDAKGIGVIEAAFIRAPIIKTVGEDVTVLSFYKGDPVLVKQGKVIALTFHPELRGEVKLHKYFLGLI